MDISCCRRRALEIITRGGSFTADLRCSPLSASRHWWMVMVGAHTTCFLGAGEGVLVFFSALFTGEHSAATATTGVPLALGDAFPLALGLNFWPGTGLMGKLDFGDLDPCTGVLAGLCLGDLEPGPGLTEGL
eukprot:CAMPEP_0177652824 /NCGR_PEP_ID=MMETSP0447-20121125/13361_1 /TAXON_ID=0 /ORGANISM="Stygamoeba regulata, Strain BSH-02190019" /LENGTH=131 /DNA_ID=CAMNT_0019156145 /DNA_START=592 /DNA_END=987 /DNA_ORIENTATION=+